MKQIFEQKMSRKKFLKTLFLSAGALAVLVPFLPRALAGVWFRDVDGTMFRAGRAYSRSFVDGDLSSSILTVTHNLGVQYCTVQVFNNSDEMVIPDAIDDSSTSALTVNLTSFGTLTGTWHVVVIGSS